MDEEAIVKCLTEANGNVTRVASFIRVQEARIESLVAACDVRCAENALKSFRGLQKSLTKSRDIFRERLEKKLRDEIVES
jgi:hypothetical protein